MVIPPTNRLPPKRCPPGESMNILFVLVPLSLLLVVFGGWAFFWAVNTDQFEDLDSPAWDILRDEPATIAPNGDHVR